MAPEPDYATMSTDIIIKGTLRKAKTWNKRFFVLREGPKPKLEYYESEKKWKGLKTDKPKRQIDLDKPWNINKKKDSKHDFLIVIFTADEYFTMAADNADVQDQWVQALHKALKPEPGSLLYKHVWHVTLENKELDLADSNLHVSLHGPHRVCLTHDCMVFVHANNSGGRDRSRSSNPVEIRITTIRVCGHQENSFFIEPGRLSGIGSGKLWMDLGDEVMAAQMHRTIIDVMFALRQEEDNMSRGRANSSGSTSGRPRNIRSHHNPPPSQIGMGKGLSLKQRIRCDSLPGPPGAGAHDSRLRTGSEGEGTMRRPNKMTSIRTHGSISPGMRNRLFRGSYKKNHRVCHLHTASLPSSEASSSEQLNSVLNSSSDFSSVGVSGGSDSTPDDCYVDGNHSPTQGYMHVNATKTPRVGKHLHASCSNGEFNAANSSTPPIHEDTPAGKTYCPNCLIHLPNDQYQPRFIAPPPPSEQPPSNPLLASSSSTSSFAQTVNEYVNVPFHSRTHSLDDSLSCNSTAASSLSASPQQHAHYMQHPEMIADRHIKHPDPYSQSPSQYSSTSENDSFQAPSPKGMLPSNVVNCDGLSPSPDDYAVMDFDSSSRYPHQTNSSSSKNSSSTPPASTSILARIASFATSVTSNGSNSHGSHANNSDYTVMSTTPSNWLANSDPSTSSKVTTSCNGYVPMKGLKSMPQDIEKRRRSVPDGVPRSGNIVNGNYGVYGHSPEKNGVVLATGTPCECSGSAGFVERGFSSKSTSYESCNSSFTKTKASPPHYNCHLRLSSEPCEIGEASPGSQSSASTLGGANPLLTTPENTSRLSTPSPSNSTDYLSMKPISQDIREMTRHPSSSSPTEHESYSRNESGYLLMNRVGPPSSNTGANGRRATIVGTSNEFSANAESDQHHHKQLAQYPHQKKERSFSTNSLDRPKHKTKRPKTLRGLNHHPIGSSIARRAYSLKQTKKHNASASESSKSASTSAFPPNSQAADATSNPFLTPGDEYVNIDINAQQQTGSLYFDTSSSSKQSVSKPRDIFKARSSTTSPQLENDYTEMTFDGHSN